MVVQIPSAVETGARLLLIDDDKDLREALAGFLSTRGLKVTSCSDCANARNRLSEEGAHFHIILSDLCLPDGDGLDLIELAKDRNPEILATIMTGYASLDTALKAIRVGAYDYITKPFSLDEIEILARNMCDKLLLEKKAAQAQEETLEAREKLHQIYAKMDQLHYEKLELMRLNREMKREFLNLSNKVDQIHEQLRVIFPQANQGDRRLR